MPGSEVPSPAALLNKHVVCQLVAVQRFCDEKIGVVPSSSTEALDSRAADVRISQNFLNLRGFLVSYLSTSCSIPLQGHFYRNFSALRTLIRQLSGQSVAAKTCVCKAHAASVRILVAIACFL
jgi:hypothetical protein